MINYRVYDGKTGDLIVEGTSRDCAKRLGMSQNTFHATATHSRSGNYKKYRFEVVPDEPVLQTSDMEAIQKWDAFVTPIRERFGIPVRHLGERKK